MQTHYGLIGSSVEESLSPAIHEYAQAKLGLSVGYKAYSLSTDSAVESFLAEFHSQGGLGLNITAPYKQHVAMLVASDLPAVNTLVRSCDGWSGASTDAEGFARAVGAFVLGE